MGKIIWLSVRPEEIEPTVTPWINEQTSLNLIYEIHKQLAECI